MPKRPGKQDNTKHHTTIFSRGSESGVCVGMLESARLHARKRKGESFDCLGGAAIGAVYAVVLTDCVAVMNIEGSTVSKLII
jgi:hypothetical protein